MYKGINNDNAKESYMRSALLKKYFRLAVRLLKFKACKNFLNSKPPEDDQSFLFMQQMHLKEKKDLYKKLELEKRLNQSKTDEDALTELPEKMDTSRCEYLKKTNLNKKKISTNNNYEDKDILKIENYENDSNVDSSNLYSSRIIKENRFNTLEEGDLHRKMNIYINEPKRIEMAVLSRNENQTYRDKISNKYREFYIQNNKDLIFGVNNTEVDDETERLNNKNDEENKEEEKNQSKKSVYFNADKDSLFHPENTKNKRNLNDVEQMKDSFRSSREILRNPDLLILRENEARNLQDEDIIDSYGARRIENPVVSSDHNVSPKFEKKSSPEEGGNNFINMLRSLKTNKNDHSRDKFDESIKNFSNINLNEDKLIENNNYNRLQTQKTFKKAEEENKMNNDFMINVQSILIDNLR